MNNDDERDYAEEAYNRAEMEREAYEEYLDEQINKFVRKWALVQNRADMTLDLFDILKSR